MKVPIAYLYVYGMLMKENGKGGNVIHVSKINPIIKWYIRIPKKYHYKFIEDMADFGLLKRLGRDSFELVGSKRFKKAPIDSLGEPLWA